MKIQETKLVEFRRASSVCISDERPPPAQKERDDKHWITIKLFHRMLISSTWPRWSRVSHKRNMQYATSPFSHYTKSYPQVHFSTAWLDFLRVFFLSTPLALNCLWLIINECRLDRLNGESGKRQRDSLGLSFEGVIVDVFKFYGTVDCFPLVYRMCCTRTAMVISIFRICAASKTYVGVMRTAHKPDFGAALESKAMSDISRLERDPSPKGLVDFRNKSRYRNQFFSVSPKRTKNTMARSGLTHWSNLIRKTVQDPADFHSSEDTDCIEGNSE